MLCWDDQFVQTDGDEFLQLDGGLRRTDGTGEGLHHSKVLDEGDELARRFVIRASAREALEEHAASEAGRRAAATHSGKRAENGNARTISGIRGFDWTSRSK